MKKLGVIFTVFMLLNLAATFVLGGCSAEKTTKIKVVTSTSLMEYIVRQVAGNLVEVTNLIPPNQHPGNFDIKPSDIETLYSATLFLLHGWPGEGYADKLIAAANNPTLVVVKATVNGNWMIPSFQMEATEKVASALSEIDAGNAAAYQKGAEAYKKKIQAKESDIMNRLNKASVASVKVIASARQADFLQWAGFNVVESYASAQSLTPQLVKELVDKGKAEGVSLVVNNLQDGEDAGKAIAEELGADNLNLSNFPGGFKNTETWEKAIDYNVNILLNALSK